MKFLVTSTLLLALCAPAVVLAGAAEKPDAAKQAFEKLTGEFEAAMTKWQEEMQKAREAGQAVDFNSSPIKDFMAKFEAAAEKHAKSDGAARFLFWVAQYGFQDREKSKKAMDTIIANHAGSPVIGELKIPMMLGYMEQAFGEEFVSNALNSIIEKNKDTDTLVGALLARGKPGMSADKESDVYKAARADLERAAKIATDKFQKMLVDVYLKGPHKAEVGDKAPNIVGEDLEGVAFKLSDYKGKVIMLDFWGDW